MYVVGTLIEETSGNGPRYLGVKVLGTSSNLDIGQPQSVDGILVGTRTRSEYSECKVDSI